MGFFTTLAAPLTLIAAPLAVVTEHFRSNVWLSLATLVVVASYVYDKYKKSLWRKLPPGPPGLPVLGNIFQLGPSQWITFTEWREKYGDIIYLNLAGQPVIVLNSLKTAADVLDRHSGANSDRPRYIVASELMSRNMFMGFTPYNNVWRTMRRASHEGLHKGIARKFHPIQLKEATLLAHQTLTAPRAWDEHLRRAATSVIMSIVYDTPPLESESDPLVREVNEFTARLTTAALPGAHFVESFPWMKHIPASLAKWKRRALESYENDTLMLKGFINKVKAQLAAGDDRPSFSATLIKDVDRHGLNEEESAWLAGSIYSAGAETTSAVMAWWMLAMVAYPEAQKRGQEEIDAVVGRDRLPNYDDFDKLPYIRAMVKETLRWRPVAPLGSPHRSIEDDNYDGYFIPAGSIVISNIWSINRDPELYGADAHEFNPARHLDRFGRVKPAPADTKEEHHSSFGFGRRICVGRHVGNDSLFIDIATILWAMNVEHAGSGKVDLEGYVDEGIVVRPPPMECKFSPRSLDVVDMLHSALDDFGIHV